MIEVEFQGSVYNGRLISLSAIEEKNMDYEGKYYVVQNKAYDLTLMDANGAIIYLILDDLKQITFL